MISMIEHVKHSTQLRWKGVHKFRPKIRMFLEVGSYQIKTAETFEELVQSFKLRHDVFHREFRGIKKNGLDFDRYDFFFDHLIIVHKEKQQIIGTYRLNSTENSKESYTALEFNLAPLVLLPGPHLELGRACIHKDYRKGSVISLLWRGIAEYMNLSGAKTLFGCSSLKVNKAREAALVYKYLHDQGHVSTHFPFRPTKAYQMEGFESWLSVFENGLNDEQRFEAEALIPSLLKSYLKLGSKIVCTPAFDKEFNCIDMLTLLRTEHLSNVVSEKYNKGISA